MGKLTGDTGGDLLKKSSNFFFREGSREAEVIGPGLKGES